MHDCHTSIAVIIFWSLTGAAKTIGHCHEHTIYYNLLDAFGKFI